MRTVSILNTKACPVLWRFPDIGLLSTENLGATSRDTSRTILRGSKLIGLWWRPLEHKFHAGFITPQYPGPKIVGNTIYYFNNENTMFYFTFNFRCLLIRVAVVTTSPYIGLAYTLTQTWHTEIKSAPLLTQKKIPLKWILHILLYLNFCSEKLKSFFILI